MSGMLEAYAEVAGEEVIDHLRQLSEPLAGMTMVHVNSTRVGGGVAEILDKLVPLSNELGIDTRWEVINGNMEFYQCTKSMHNALQGNPLRIPDHLYQAYEETNVANAERLRGVLEEADVVFIHDPQPAPLLGLCPNRKGKWVWRCHIDVSHPDRIVWKYLRQHLSAYDASVFSLPAFAQPLPNLEYIIPPSIDPLSEKNVDIDADELQEVAERFNLDTSRPIVAQISRYDRFKDPVGVIRSYRLAKKFMPQLQLVLAGGGASDDPEGELVLEEVHSAAEEDDDIHVLLLPADAHRTINALQRIADIVIQKSIREGFGLTVTEGMWKGKPVIGGDTGGIRLQVVDHHTGFLVNTPEGAALRMRYLFRQPAKMHEMSSKAREFVRDNFLLTRQLREYLTLSVGLLHGAANRIIIG
ncbi:glycosyltransferase [Thiohalomonas denitrificans]|uniref:Trehalose synthase n=1 Tax=Thiohalomonas denitrificans TaxID=415747 RepID=A0A1G5QPF7_9GAMM|nr:glycosyltransferase [Thiohalomonas denitrificans]SCZ63420.1 trehalose synthase [Thiohalomonas denitrificans]